ncbi:hypothetical protein BDV09DRAFT_100791 [Aspergillus tetrazonus]
MKKNKWRTSYYCCRMMFHVGWAHGLSQNCRVGNICRLFLSPLTVILSSSSLFPSHSPPPPPTVVLSCSVPAGIDLSSIDLPETIRTGDSTRVSTCQVQVPPSLTSFQGSLCESRRRGQRNNCSPRIATAFESALYLVDKSSRRLVYPFRSVPGTWYPDRSRFRFCLSLAGSLTSALAQQSSTPGFGATRALCYR